MKLINTTTIPSRSLRMITTWVCRQLKLPRSDVRSIKVRNRSGGYATGLCYYETGHVVASIPRIGARYGQRFNYTENKWECLGEMRYHTPQSRLDELIRILAHELAHRLQRGGSEEITNYYEYDVVQEFNRNRETLTQKWSMA